MFSQQSYQAYINDANETKSTGFCLFWAELVGGTSKKQNWRGLGIAFIVITVICLFIAAAVALSSIQRPTINDKRIISSEQEILNLKALKPWNGTWISDKYFSYLDINDSLWIYNCETLKEELILKRDIIQQDNIGDETISPSARYVLVPIKKEKTRPYYIEYQYDIYDKTKMITPLSWLDDRRILVSAVSYSHSDHLFAFIHNFDVYIYNINNKTSFRVTSDGNQETIHNGLVEWIYEYEIFNRHILLFWSPKDDYLAFIKLNLTRIPKMHYLRYDFISDNDDQYSIPYPKYNDPLPILDIFVLNVKLGKVINIPRPNIDERQKKSEIYIYHVVWCGRTCLCVVYGNRMQNTSIIQLYEVTSGKVIVKSKFTEEARRGFLLPRFLKPHFSPSATATYIIRFDTITTDKLLQKAFARVVRIDFNQTHPQVTVGSPDKINVHEIIRVDNIGRVYFTGARQNDSLEKHLYRWTHSNRNSDLECISCNQSCDYASAQFSLGNGNYFILECFGLSIPYSTLYNRTGKIALINDNEPFREWVANRYLPRVDYFTVPLDQENTGNGY